MLALHDALPISRWHSREQQGTALGIFGLGNIGTSLTHFLAPTALLALGWPGVLKIWALTLGVIAIAFWFLTRDDPTTVARRKGEAPVASFASQIAPIRRLQGWRFSTYYFFTFGAYVALSPWLPRSYIAVYRRARSEERRCGKGWVITVRSPG